MGSWKEIDHTADLAIEALADSPEDLIETACLAMASLIYNPKNVTPRDEIAIAASGFDLTETAASTLAEALYWINQKAWVFSEFRCKKFSEHSIELTGLGEPRNPSSEPLNAEIKAATYCGFHFGPDENGKWFARVVFDV